MGVGSQGHPREVSIDPKARRHISGVPDRVCGELRIA
jgi:hypothetical protein